MNFGIDYIFGFFRFKIIGIKRYGFLDFWISRDKQNFSILNFDLFFSGFLIFLILIFQEFFFFFETFNSSKCQIFYYEILGFLYCTFFYFLLFCCCIQGFVRFWDFLFLRFFDFEYLWILRLVAQHFEFFGLYRFYFGYFDLFGFECLSDFECFEF